MRVFRPMLRWLSAGIFALTLLLSGVIPAGAADTGTYQILNYITTLEPQSNGQVKITYEQSWKVLSGHIPWITVGLPNSHYSIQDFSGAATKVSSANSGGFTGVRVDLDRDYQSGQTFNIKFTVLQSNLLERLTSEKVWRINYTPGWYDNGVINILKVILISPVDYQTYSSVSPMPASVNNNVITWERSNLSPGSRFNVAVESTDGSFLTVTSGSTDGGSGISSWMVVLFVAIGLFIVFGLIMLAVRRYRQANEEAVKARVAAIEKEMAENKKRKAEVEEGFEKYVEKEDIQPDAQGRYYDRSYGGYITPAIWAAVILSQRSGSGSSNPSSGSTGHCACVSCACACACACAGGGAAGCSRKSLHECPDCLKSQDK